MAVSMSLDVSSNNPFTRILNANLITALIEVENKWARRLHAIVIQYPAERSGQKYRRTNQFRDRWRIVPPRFIGGSLVCEVRNDSDFARYVVGDDIANWQNQAYHAGRWYLFRKLVEASEAQFRQEAQDAINTVLAPARITP